MRTNTLSDECLYKISAATPQIGKPQSAQIPGLRYLWKEAFGDSDEFLDIFHHTAFHPDRCHCVTINGEIAAALYWFDCTFQNKPVAYIYAVATASRHRGQGLCHALIKYTHAHLASIGYIGAILVPGSKELFAFYEEMGYRTCTYVDEISYEIADNIEPSTVSNMLQLQTITASRYAQLRYQYLPANAIIQENENLTFLEAQAQFFAGKNFILACQQEGDFLHGIELLGNTFIIPNLLYTLHCKKGAFRTPGTTKPFAMYYDFITNNNYPEYFGFAFD